LKSASFRAAELQFFDPEAEGGHIYEPGHTSRSLAALSRRSPRPGRHFINQDRTLKQRLGLRFIDRQQKQAAKTTSHVLGHSQWRDHRRNFLRRVRKEDVPQGEFGARQEKHILGTRLQRKRTETVMAAGHSGRESEAEANRGALDWLNFFLADVQGGLGPFLAIFLTSSQHWNPGQAGIVLTLGGVATVLARSPAGALADATVHKRALIASAALAVAAAAAAIAVYPQFWIVAIAQGASGIADAVFPVAISAISLGIVGRKLFTSRVGRNEAWNHAGNVASAIAAGLAGYFIAQGAVLWIIAVLSVASCVAVYGIDAKAIDHDVARGEEVGQDGTPEALQLLLTNKPLLWFTAAITLFHFANAAMLPLAGEKLSVGKPDSSPLFISACIIVAQLVMVPMAILVGRKADAWGRKPLFLAAFAVLPVRGLLFAIASDPYAIIAIQILDGVGAGLFGALFYIVISDFTRGTGRYNLAQGMSGASWGLGAALSNGVAGVIAARFGFSAAFLFLGVCALGAFAIFLLAVPESRNYRTAGTGKAERAALPQSTRA
jgi:MFS family permease